jgi:hypothetical protein
MIQGVAWDPRILAPVGVCPYRKSYLPMSQGFSPQALGYEPEQLVLVCIWKRAFTDEK